MARMSTIKNNRAAAAKSGKGKGVRNIVKPGMIPARAAAKVSTGKRKNPKTGK